MIFLTNFSNNAHKFANDSENTLVCGSQLLIKSFEWKVDLTQVKTHSALSSLSCIIVFQADMNTFQSHGSFIIELFLVFPFFLGQTSVKTHRLNCTKLHCRIIFFQHIWVPTARTALFGHSKQFASSNDFLKAIFCDENVFIFSLTMFFSRLAPCPVLPTVH